MLYIIIAGSREFTNYNILEQKLNFLLQNTTDDITIISGTASGADKLGERYAKNHNYNIIKKPANWKKYGKRAGYVRNVEMAKIATHCVVFRVNLSKGSTHMINIAKQKNLVLRVYDYKK